MFPIIYFKLSSGVEIFRGLVHLRKVDTSNELILANVPFLTVLSLSISIR